MCRCCCCCQGEPQCGVVVAGGEALRFSERGQGVGWRTALGANQGGALKTDVGQNWKNRNKVKDNNVQQIVESFCEGQQSEPMRCRKWQKSFQQWSGRQDV